MTKQNKNIQQRAKAKQITAMHKNGEKGPAKTTPVHGKKWTYRHNPEAMKKLTEFLRGPEPKETKPAKPERRGPRTQAQSDFDA